MTEAEAIIAIANGLHGIELMLRYILFFVILIFFFKW